MSVLLNINEWKSNFGLLPIKINPINGDDKYLMLNGGNGDFCLKTSNGISGDECYQNSWSTNTKNFVVLDNEYIKIFNWLTKKEEKINSKDIENNETKLYKYLLSKSYKTESDVVPFIINIFRQLRNVTQEKENPSATINLLYQLLISLNEDYSKINFEQWNIDEVELPTQFEYFVDLLKQGVKQIPPNLDLLLRHSSGALFQEAHREVVYFNSDRDLFGGVSKELGIKKDSYSSIHYTPQYLARSIVENSLKNIDINKPTLKIFDPACGSSEFLIETLKQLKNLQYVGRITLVGWDTSESAIKTSKFLLNYESKTQWKDELVFDIKKVDDSLAEYWEADYDLIVMNPPFISWELLKNKELKDSLLTAFGDLKMIKPNQASAFFYKAILSLNANGVIGCVLPSSIFTFDSYKALRNVISEELSLKLIAKLGNYVFEDALTDVSFFIGQKPKTNAIPKLIWSKNEKGIIQNVLTELRKMEVNNQFSVNEKEFSIYTPTTFDTGNWKINSFKEEKIKKDLDRFVADGVLTTISTVFSVKQGIRTGNNSVFKISKEIYETLPIEEKSFFKIVGDNESIKNGVLSIKNYSWYPYNIENGTSLLSNEEELISKLPYFFENHLSPNKIELNNRRKKIPNWWDLSDRAPRLLPISNSIVSTEFGGSNSFAINDENLIMERGYAWIPKKEFETDDYYFYLALFSSSVFDTLLSIYSKQLAGGKWYDLGAKYTSIIPIPNVHRKEVKAHFAYRKLVDLGKELSEGNSFIKEIIGDVLKNSFYKMIV